MPSKASLEPVPLIGGISQQHDTLRPPTHVPDAQNVLFDLSVGARNRPGTVFDRKFTAAPNSDLGLDIWRWNESERYIIVRGSGGGAPVFRIFRDGGDEAAVTISGAASAYLGSGGAGSADLKFCPQPSYALAINSTVAAALTTTDSYTIERHRPTYRDLIGYTTTTGNYLQTDEDDASADKGFYKYDPGTYKASIINFPTVTDSWSINNGFYDDATGAPCGFRIAFRRVKFAGVVNAAWDNTAKTLTLVGAFATYFANARSGDMINLTVGSAGAALAGWQRIGTASANVLTLPEANAANGTASSNFTDALYGETNNARIGIMVEVNLDFTKIAVQSMHDIANEIQKAMQNAGASNAGCVWVPQSSGGAFQVTGPFLGDNAVTYAPVAPTLTVGATGDLTAAGRPFASPGAPGIFPGSGGAAPDASDTASLASRWTRQAAPSQAAGKPSPTTMPMYVNRSAANTFDVDVTAWAPRTAGDSTTNKGVDLIRTGQKITDAVTHQERLFLSGGPYVASSRVSDNLDFWVANPAQVVDSDPISKKIPGRYQGTVRSLLTWNDVLVVFHESGQFEMSSGDAGLTPTTAQLTRSTTYPTGNVHPQASSTQLFFVSVSDTSINAQLYEYAYNDIRAASEASLITAHVPTLLPASIRGVASVPATQSILVLPSSGSTVFVYRFHYDGADKVQSAWTKLVFDPGYRIAGTAADDTRFWLLVENTSVFTVAAGALGLTIPAHGYVDTNPIVFSESTTTPSVNGTKYVKRLTADTIAIYDDAGLVTATTLSAGGTLRWHTGDYTLETLSLAEPAAPSGWPCSVHMDRQLTLTGVYAAGKTTFTLPSTPATVPPGGGQFNGFGSTLNYIVLGPAFGVDAGKVIAISEYGTTYVRVTGDYSAGPVMLGRFFSYSMVLPRPMVRNGRSRPNIAPVTLVCGLTLAYKNSCSWSVRVDHPGVMTRTRTFDNVTTPKSGEMFTLLGGESGKSIWTLSDAGNDKAVRPASIVWVQWEVEQSEPISEGG